MDTARELRTHERYETTKHETSSAHAPCCIGPPLRLAQRGWRAMSPIERLQMFTIAARFPRPRAGREQFPRPEDADLACQTMMRSSTVPSFGSEFDDFLHAPIEEDTNGTLLSVLSALARLDVDPWVEASRLAQLPSDIAILELTTLIAPLCDGHPGRRDSKTIVPRLIALLPRRAATDVSHKTLHGVGALHFRGSVSRSFIWSS